MFTDVDQECDEKSLSQDLLGVLRMNARPPFNDQLANVQSNLFEYLGGHDLYSYLMGAKWKPGADRAAVRAMLAGLWPRE